MNVPEAPQALRPVRELVKLAGRQAVVTGAGRGIGEQIAWRLAEAGADVVVGDINVDAAEAVARRLGREFGRSMSARYLDVTDTSTLAAAAQEAASRGTGLHIWVNNAAIYPMTGPVTDASDEHIDDVLRVNVRGTYAGAREAARVMRDGGVIVNLASTAAFKSSRATSAYIGSKAAVVGLTRSLALELADRHIRVLGVAPTAVETPGVLEQTQGLRESGIDIRERLGANPLGRAAEPDDIARVVLFCCTPLASMMTGSTLAVDGGALL